MTPRVWRWGDDPGPLRDHVLAGGVVALPTESSYALGADPRSSAGVEAIFTLKRRPPRKALPVVVGRVEHLRMLGLRADSGGLDRVRDLWPAALSIVLPLSRAIPAAAGESGLAVRVPAHDRLRALLVEIGVPLTATSANSSGRPPITRFDRLSELVAGSDTWLVDDGVLPGGPPSTLVRWSRGRFELLREGRVPFPPRAETGAQGDREDLP